MEASDYSYQRIDKNGRGDSVRHAESRGSRQDGYGHLQCAPWDETAREVSLSSTVTCLNEAQFLWCIAELDIWKMEVVHKDCPRTPSIQQKSTRSTSPLSSTVLN